MSDPHDHQPDPAALNELQRAFGDESDDSDPAPADQPSDPSSDADAEDGDRDEAADRRLEVLTALGIADDPDGTPLSRSGVRERRLQRLHVGVAADEAREPARARGVESRVQGVYVLEREAGDRLGHAFHLELV